MIMQVPLSSLNFGLYSKPSAEKKAFARLRSLTARLTKILRPVLLDMLCSVKNLITVTGSSLHVEDHCGTTSPVHSRRDVSPCRRYNDANSANLTQRMRMGARSSTTPLSTRAPEGFGCYFGCF